MLSAYLVAFGFCAGLLGALTGIGGGVLMTPILALHFGIPWWYGLAFPLGYTAGALIALDSIRWRLVHRVQWKGRTYA